MDSSLSATVKHIRRVQEILGAAIVNLLERQRVHDVSKTESPEIEGFDEFTPKLAACTYGSPEYNQFLKELQKTLAHHYARNSHHPEHFSNGIRGMSLLDLLEMLCDWKAATERHNDGNLIKSIELNQERFGYSNELREVFLNTVKELGLQ